jgi:hypothetical protein
VPPNNPRTAARVAEMLSQVPEGHLTTAQALAWLMFRDVSKGNFVDIGDAMPVAVEVATIPPKPSKAERRLSTLARAPRLRPNERHVAFLGAQDRRVQRMSKTRFRVDRATGEPAIEMKPRRSSSALLALATAYGIADEPRRFLALADATRELLDACAAGRIPVTGLRNANGDRVLVDSAWWADARLCGGDEPYSVLARGRPGSSEWHDMLFDRSAIETLWPRVIAIETSAIESQPLKTGKRGPAQKYLPDLVKKLDLIKRSNPDAFYGGITALRREIEQYWRRVPAPPHPLPKSRSQRDEAIGKARAEIRAGDEAKQAHSLEQMRKSIRSMGGSAGVSPELSSITPELFSTTSATPTR